MTCASPFLISARRAAPLLATALVTAAARPAAAQQATPPALAPYRAPTIAMVQPPAVPGAATGAGSVPRDRPVVVFRFAAGEPDDPLDVRSFVVAVDGADRTALFQTTSTAGVAQAWGPLADADDVRQGALAPGAHRVVARICSTRGACASTEVQLLVVPGPVVVADDDAAGADGKPGRMRRVLGAVLSVTRKLVLPDLAPRPRSAAARRSSASLNDSLRLRARTVA